MAGYSLLVALKAFDTAARLGTLSAAARALGLQQPTLSAHVSRLEREYGVELFYRRGRRLELTAFGSTLRECTHRLFSAEVDAQNMLAAVSGRLGGHLRLRAVGPYNVMPMIRAFRETWPHVGIAVAVGDSRQIVDDIRDYQGDIGVLVHGVDDPSLYCMPYRRQALVIFASASHPLAARQGLTLRDLHQQAFVLREEGSTTRRVFEQTMQAAGLSFRMAVEMGSREAVREAVAQGLGLGVVADAAYVADARLRVLRVAGFDATTHVHLICRSERRQVPLIAAFFDTAARLRGLSPSAQDA